MTEGLMHFIRDTIADAIVAGGDSVQIADYLADLIDDLAAYQCGEAFPRAVWPGEDEA